MTKILADDLENSRVSALVKFLGSVSNRELARRGKRIEVPGLTGKKVKFFLRKFLHTNHLSGYGVLDIAGTFEIVRIKPEAKSENKAKKYGPLKHPVPYGPPIPCFVKPTLRVEWQGKPPPKKAHSKK